MNKIALILIAYKSNQAQLQQALECCDLFDEVILHINDQLTACKFHYKNSKLKIIYEPEQMTPQEALNQAIDASSCEYILPFTDDDFFHRENLKYMIDNLENYCNADIIHYPVYVGNDKRCWGVWGKNSVIQFDRLFEDNLIPFSCVYKKNVWKWIKGYKDVPFSDWFFWIEASYNHFSFYYLDNPVYYHRQEHKKSLANKESEKFSMKEVKYIFKQRLFNDKT